MITENGVARITDFGIAQIIAEPGVAIGNGSTTSRQEDARYKSPEQVDHRFFKLKKSEVRKESDVYSFGMTAYEVFLSACIENPSQQMVTFAILRFSSGSSHTKESPRNSH